MTGSAGPARDRRRLPVRSTAPGRASRLSKAGGSTVRRFGNARTSALLVRRAPVGPAAAPAAPATAKVPAGADEAERSRRSPGGFSVSVNPRSITLYDFAIDVAEPKAAHRAALADMVAELKAQRLAPTVVTLDSYTDDSGGEAHNDMLSLRRGLAVGALLGGVGVPLLQSPHGERDPSPNDTPAQRSRNRRVVVTFIFTATPKPPVPVPVPEPTPKDTPVPPGPCDMMPWLCKEPDKPEKPKDCPSGSWLCDPPPGPVPVPWPLPWPVPLPLATLCVVQPEVCALATCLADIEACLRILNPFDDGEPDRKPSEPDSPEPEEGCDGGMQMRGLLQCEAESDRLKHQCTHMTVLEDLALRATHTSIGCESLEAARQACHSKARRQAHCDEKPPAGKPDCCQGWLDSVPIKIDNFHALKVRDKVIVHDHRAKHSRNIKPASPGVECDVAFLGAVALDADRSKYGPCLGEFREALDKKDAANYGGQMGSDSAADREDIVKTVIENGNRISADTFWGDAERPVGIDIATGDVTNNARITGVPNRAHIIPEESRP